jgi:hypothetical protein
VCNSFCSLFHDLSILFVSLSFSCYIAPFLCFYFFYVSIYFYLSFSICLNTSCSLLFLPFFFYLSLSIFVFLFLSVSLFCLIFQPLHIFLSVSHLCPYDSPSTCLYYSPCFSRLLSFSVTHSSSSSLCSFSHSLFMSLSRWLVHSFQNALSFLTVINGISHYLSLFLSSSLFLVQILTLSLHVTLSLYLCLSLFLLLLSFCLSYSTMSSILPLSLSLSLSIIPQSLSHS